MPNGNEGDMYRAILSQIKNKLEKSIVDRHAMRGIDQSRYEGYCMAIEETKNMIEAYEQEAAAIIQYVDGETGQWLPGSPSKYRFK